MLGFDLDIWDYITFVVVLIIKAGALRRPCSSLVCQAGSPLRGSTQVGGAGRRSPEASGRAVGWRIGHARQGSGRRVPKQQRPGASCLGAGHLGPREVRSRRSGRCVPGHGS